MTDKDREPEHTHWMALALEQAQIAGSLGEVPIGAILVANNEIIGKGFNQPVSGHDASAHAEICALRQASQLRQNYRLPGTTLYVTIEPCTMCAGALIHARIDTLVFGAREPRAGAIVSQQQLLDARYFNHRVSYIEGVLREECSELIQNFFQIKRRG